MSVIRVFRIARVIRLLKFLQPLNQLIGAFYLSIPRLANVGGVLALCLLIFALLGLTLFSPMLVPAPEYDTTQLSDRSANFCRTKIRVVGQLAIGTGTLVRIGPVSDQCPLPHAQSTCHSPSSPPCTVPVIL